MHTIGVWSMVRKMKIVENETQKLYVLEYGEYGEKTEKRRK
jgi:hypothetical protein